jgi:hypothetical protein
MAEPLLWRWLWLGAAASAAALLGCGTEESQEPGSVVINEVVPVNAGWYPDRTHDPEDCDAPPYCPGNEFDDFLELYNRSNQPIDISQYSMRVRGYDEWYQLGSDGSGRVLPAGEVVLLWADGGGEGTGIHLPFRLGNGGDWVELRDDQGRRADRVTYTYQRTPQAYARIPDGEEWTWCPCPSARVPNGDRCPPESQCAISGTGGTSTASGTGGSGAAGGSGGAGGASGAGGGIESGGASGGGGAPGLAGNGPSSGAGGV